MTELAEAPKPLPIIERNSHSGKLVMNVRRVDVTSLNPHGDRVLIEIMELDMTTPTGIVLGKDPANQEADEGWLPGVIKAVGSGHRLDTPDVCVPIQLEPLQSPFSEDPDSVHQKTLRAWQAMNVVTVDTATGSGLVRVPSVVPMPFVPGMVVAVAKYGGAPIYLKNLEYRNMTQAHVLWIFQGLEWHE